MVESKKKGIELKLLSGRAHLMKTISVLLTILLLTACTITLPHPTIDPAINNYEAISSQIQLGDNLNDLLPKLKEAQAKVPMSSLKPADRYYEDGREVYIHYQRTGRQPDDLTTDDEFTPLVFVDNKLVAIGWQSLGGPKSTGKVVPQTNVYSPRSRTNCTSTTIGGQVNTHCY